MIDEPHGDRLGDDELELTVVMPFYNPGPGFRSHLENLREVLDARGIEYEIIAVSDGSSAESVSSIAHLSQGRIRTVVLEHNVGKGEALRIGLAQGKGSWLGFIDADGDIHPRLLTGLLDCVASGRPDIVYGSKRHPDAMVHYPPLRRVYSAAHQGLCRALFNLRVRDTQTGLKLMSREVVADVLPRMVERRYAFDLELFVVARKRGFSRLVEAPVRIDYQFHSTISPRAVMGMLSDTFAIWFRLRFTRRYSR